VEETRRGVRCSQKHGGEQTGWEAEVVSDLGKGISEEIEADANAFIRFPNLKMKSQYAQEVASFPETHHRGPIYQSP
jgi:hypothetical protein